MTSKQSTPPVPDVQRMRDQDIALLGILDQIRFAVTRRQPDQRRLLRRLVSELRTALETDMKERDEILYPNLLLTSRSDMLRQTVTSLMEDFGRLDKKFDRFQAAWSSDWIGRRWPAYCAEFLAFISDVRLRIDREEAALYPLLESHVIEQ